MDADSNPDLAFYPDPVLRKVAHPVQAFDQQLDEVVQGMLRRMYASQGVGLAAPQIGIGARILVLNETGDPERVDEELVLINPSVVERSGAETFAEEGCLSFPGIYAEVKRPENCIVEAQDRKGTAIRLELTGFQSRILQHEYDHLEGVLLVDRMSPADRLRHKAALEELKGAYRQRLAKAAAGSDKGQG